MVQLHDLARDVRCEC
nr:hypothetical protein [Demequina lutea]